MNTIQIPRNSRQDLLNELNGEKPFNFTCAKCGKPMSLLKGGLVQPILSESAREGFNTYLITARKWLEYIAELYRIRNYNVEDRPCFIDGVTSENDARNIGDMPLIKTIDRSESNPNQDNPKIIIGPDEKGILGERVLSNEEIASIRQGLYGTETAEQVRYLLKVLDLDINFIESLTKLPLLKDFEERLNNEETKVVDFVCTINTLLHPLDTVKNLGVLSNLIFDQTAVQLWVNKTKEQLLLSQEPSKLTNHLKQEGFIPQKFSLLWEYLRIFEACLRTLSDEFTNQDEGNIRWTGNELSSLEKRLQEIYKSKTNNPLSIQEIVKLLVNQLERSVFLLVILFGHEPRDTQDKFHEIFHSTLNDPVDVSEKIDLAYQFPEFTKISYQRYGEIMTSPQVIYKDALSNIIDTNEKQSLIDRPEEFQKITHILTKQQTGETLTKEEIEQLRVTFSQGDLAKILEKTLDFACTGTGTILVQAENTNNPNFNHNANLIEDQQVIIPEICGWYPKKDPTISVTFLGTPGSGKTNAYVSAFATFITGCKYKGIIFNTVNSRDNIQESQILTIFDEGRKPKRTRKDERHALEIKVSPISEDEKLKGKSLYFVFVDIPGETAIKGTKNNNWDSAVIQLLASAPIVVFFFDVSCDPDFLSSIEFGSNKEAFERMIAGQKTNIDVRGELAKQRQIHFIDKLLEKRKNLNVSVGEQGCMLYIPKIDYFIDRKINIGQNQLEEIADNPQFEQQNQEDNSPLFFHSFFEEMIQKGVLQPRKDNVQNDSVDYVSTGGILTNKETITIEDQIETMKTISTQGRNSLKKIGNAIGAPKWRVTDAKIFINSMLSCLESSFSQFWVLPFSARGGSDEDINNGGKLPQKLSEYCFLGPIAMAFDSMRQEQTSNTSVNQQTTQIDFSSYPRPNANENAKRDRAIQLKNALLRARDRNELTALRQNGQYSQDEFSWVFNRLLDDSERQRVRPLFQIVQNPN